MARSYSPRSTGQIVGASLLIGVGVAFLLVENHVLRGSDLRRLWPMILVLVGGAKMIQGRESRLGGTVMFVIGVLLELSAFNVIERPERLWPVLLVLTGLILLWRALRPRLPGGYAVPGDSITGRADAFAMFGGVESRINDQEFTGTELTTIFGGYNLDLRKAQMKGPTAVITVTIICGGMELRVPESWNVEIAGSPIFGGFGDETNHPDPRSNSPRLLIQGSVFFGGVHVKN